MTTDKRPLTMRDYKHKQPKSFPVRMQVVFVVDGQPVGNAAGETTVTPSANGEPVTITFPLDVRQLAALLDQALGSRTPASKLWTPGQGQPVVLAKKD